VSVTLPDKAPASAATLGRWRGAGFGPGTAGAVRAGLVVLVLTTGLNAANYLFQVLAARFLGPSDYGALAALLAIIMVVGLPFGAVQLVVARTVAHENTRGRPEEGAAFARQALGLVAVAGLLAAAITIIASAPIATLLQVDGAAPIAITGLAIAFAVMLPAALGVLQGEQRYIAYGVGPLAGALARLLAIAVAVGVGLSLNGALWATLLATSLGVAIVVWQARHTLLLGFGRAAAMKAAARSAARSLRQPLARVIPASIGLMALASITNIDIVVVKGALSSVDAGVFGAAGLIAKVALFVPVAIVAVLQPRVAARVARGRPAEDILARSVLVTVAFCAVFTAICYAAPSLIVHSVYGADFEGAIPILGLFALFISLMSVASVQVNYHLSRQEHRFAYILAGAACVHALALVLFHDSLHQVLYVNLAVAVAVLVVHEVAVQSMLPSLREALRRSRPAEGV
jgi:O-antigen/teichoic acid export membrane protein